MTALRVLDRPTRAGLGLLAGIFTRFTIPSAGGDDFVKLVTDYGTDAYRQAMLPWAP
jgi:hypothetical protein